MARITDRRRFNGRTPSGLTVEERFWQKVKGGLPSECWVWTASTDPSGYGMFCVSTGRNMRAHAWAYRAARGAVPDGLHLDHLCENKRCVNPWHLEPVTPLENTRRGPRSRIPRTRGACLYGHPYDASAPTYRGRDGSERRQCVTCNREYMRVYNRMTRAEIDARKAAGLPVVNLAAIFAADLGQAA